MFDSHDDRDDDGEGESVEEHKSVIMHLLSQVRLGMDLTKVGSVIMYAWHQWERVLFLTYIHNSLFILFPRWCFLLLF